MDPITAKTVKKAIEASIEPIIKPISQTAGEIARDVLLVFGNKIRLWAMGNYVNVCEESSAMLRQRGYTDMSTLRAISEKFGLMYLQSAPAEDDPSLQSLWAKLLANALDPSFDEELRTAYMSIIKELSPLDVRILIEIRKDYGFNLPNNVKAYKQLNMDSRLNASFGEALVSIDNLLRLCLIKTTSEVLVPAGAFFGSGEESVLQQTAPVLSALGEAFVRACIQ